MAYQEMSANASNHLHDCVSRHPPKADVTKRNMANRHMRGAKRDKSQMEFCKRIRKFDSVMSWYFERKGGKSSRRPCTYGAILDKKERKKPQPPTPETK